MDGIIVALLRAVFSSLQLHSPFNLQIFFCVQICSQTAVTGAGYSNFLFNVFMEFILDIMKIISGYLFGMKSKNLL